MSYETSGISYAQYLTLVSIGTVSASLSLLGSLSIVYVAHKRLHEIYHRLVFLLSLSDTVVSLCVTLEPYLLPTHTLYPMAVGNTASCSTIGFLVRASAMCVSLYNCYLSIYFLLLIR